jgi:hypothetical protein
MPVVPAAATFYRHLAAFAFFSAVFISSRSVRDRGYDAGKKISGRKLHLLVDTLGFILEARVQPANVSYRVGAREVLSPLQTRPLRLQKISADASYRGALVDWVQACATVGVAAVSNCRS